MSDRAVRFKSVLMGLANYFHVEVTPFEVEAYTDELADLSIAAIEGAARAAMREHGRKWMPKIGELRALAGELSPAARASIAWDAFYGARNSRASVNFDDVVIHAVCRHLGGWCHIWETLLEEHTPHVRREFEACYVRYLASGIPPGADAHLPGRTELERIAGGFEPDPVRQIATGLPRTVVRLLGGSAPAPLPALQSPRGGAVAKDGAL